MNTPDADLVPMTESEFPQFRERVIREYAEESVAAGRVDGNLALEWARKETEKLLPDGIRTRDTLLLVIVSHQNPGASIGSIWCATDPHNPANAFVFDLFIRPEHRGHGYGTAAMTRLDVVLRARGYKAVGLHVYAHNQAAVGLYRKLGYQTTSLNLSKEL